ncbi:hypothetical protein HID58_022450 [Brassica napus]|uniref:Uncharacterized protein n=1 Tax=Brassica napus TaxID=3708 RepID=A0ABQ8D075_BRANA|nr:hypothetical protein HID58_022450 [Brassica napus]
MVLLVMCLFAWLKLRRKDGSYKVKKNKILEFLGKNKFPLITKSSESNTAWVYSSPVKLQVIIFAKIYDFQKPWEPFLTLFGIEDANKTVAAMLKEKCKIDLCVVRITAQKRESRLMLILQAVTTTGSCEESMLSLRHRTNQHDVGRGKVKVSVIKMKKKTTTIGD